ncbi:hypothetical protein MWU78_00380 [Arenibacter sp. F26102]|uniref:polysialyltransferase family glycosyltransferase n=1 Tax=Arenibacter sp. F26102 TaxID=2926416 RepID=UPI001FF568E3|nr:polysialyltransferase family glycosyltransferase [Arenibacter sp. F26102]MCK0144100.1 hypothetical protein [Arenibacter sp. F26102]
MKYLFHIHSNINLLTAILSVEHRNINKNNVVFILARGIETDFKVNKITLPEVVYYHSFNTLKSLPNLKFRKNKEVLSKIDGIIDKYVDEAFTYFCPNSRVPVYRAFFSHPKCVSVNYIEDGMDAYLSKEELLKKFPVPIPFHQKIADYVFRFFPVFCANRLNYVSDRFLPDLKDSVSEIYCLSDKSFLGQDNGNRNILQIKANSYYNDANIEFTNVFVFDAVKNQNVIKEKDLFNFVLWFCEDYFRLDAIAIKFHPFQDEKEIEEIIAIFNKNNITVKVIPSQLVLEAVFINNKQLNIFGIGSSLLVYAALFGIQNVHVLYPYFELAVNFKSPRLTIWNDIFLQRNDIILLNKEFQTHHSKSI